MLERTTQLRLDVFWRAIVEGLEALARGESYDHPGGDGTPKLALQPLGDGWAKAAINGIEDRVPQTEAIHELSSEARCFFEWLSRSENPELASLASEMAKRAGRLRDVASQEMREAHDSWS